MNDHSNQQCGFLSVHTALRGVVKYWQLGCGPKTGGMRVLVKLKHHCSSAMQTPIRQKRPIPNSIFSPLKLPPPAQCRPGRMPPNVARSFHRHCMHDSVLLSHSLNYSQFKDYSHSLFTHCDDDDCVTFHVLLITVFIATVDDTLTWGGGRAVKRDSET